MNRGLQIILPVILYATTAWAEPPLPDPTRPPDFAVIVTPTVEATEPVTGFTVTAIRIDKNDRSAIINGQLVRVGDMVGTARVLEIHPAEVVLYRDQGRLVTRLYNKLLKTERESNGHTKALN